ncbi:hypothetical protein LCL97_00055 [Seohaeicola saemankumensis]|nr:hypothetical protein [Seohaeicola saemankumensis]MCA0869204.1 hypothetical protein [Seohaeicola saemankumensis]
MARPIATTARNVALMLAMAGPAGAQEAASRLVEMPGHRALFDQLEENRDLTPFVTDGCSGGMSDAWRLVADRFEGFAEVLENEPPWEACCVTHDRAYHDAGGATTPEQSFDARLEADRTLRSCVSEMGTDRAEELAPQYGVTPDQVAAGFRTVAGAMYLAVRFGGGPCSGLPWRWGFGFDQCSVLDGAFKSD